MFSGALTLLVCSAGSFVAGVEIGRRHPDDAWDYVWKNVTRVATAASNTVTGLVKRAPAPPATPAQPAATA